MVKEELPMSVSLFLDFPGTGNQCLVVVATKTLFIKELLAPVFVGLQLFFIPKRRFQGA
jgi:hypothetical protein